MQRLKSLFPFFLLVLVGMVAAWWLFPVAHPDGGLRLPLDSRQIIDRSRATLRSLNIDLAGSYPVAELVKERGILQQLQAMHGIDGANAVAVDSTPAFTPGYRWKVLWYREKPFAMRFGSSNRSDEEDALKFLRGDITSMYDVHGRLLAFHRSIPESAAIPSLNQDEAKSLALQFIRTQSAFGTIIGDTTTVASSKTIDQPRRKDIQFLWNSRTPILDNPLQVRATVSGNLLTEFEAKPEIPPQYSRSSMEQYYYLGMVLALIGVGIALIIFAIKRIRAYEIGFRLAILMGIATAIVFDLEIFLSSRQELGWNLLFSLIIPPIFTGGAIVLLWALAESISRETWREKLISFDLIGHGHFFHSRIGESLIRGMGAGAAILAAWLATFRLLGLVMPVSLVPSESGGIHVFSIAVPALYSLAHAFFAIIFSFAFFTVFLVSFLRNRLRWGPIIIALAGTIMALFSISDYDPLLAGLVIQLVLSAGLLWTFYRYDAFAALVAFFTFEILQDVGSLMFSGNAHYAASGYVLMGVGGVLLLFATATLFRKQETSDFDALVPAFARHISERQRLQQELEIARAVQMSFLPKRNPVRYKLDIASRCAPALEVGGDYYDFIELTDSKLGVAIGDVSGKGTQAAFFMTLTKGFLRALANVSNSPASILTQVNKLFYESVDRGMFISMVYGIFDTEACVLTLARAGHNPVIVHKSQSKDVQTMNPMGLALGLDPGETFSRSIEEVRVPFQQGDVFVFYTDGFPEAMNKAKEEFGERRLSEAVTGHSTGTAAEIMHGVFREMKKFVGNAQQHDDLTIVVVKIA